MKVENKTIIITDPCYIINKKQDSDWEKCDFGDNMEALGIYEVAPEDFALAEFVDSSKLELQQIVRNGLDMLRKENS